jgi:hypothetical protein
VAGRYTKIADGVLSVFIHLYLMYRILVMPMPTLGISELQRVTEVPWSLSVLEEIQGRSLFASLNSSRVYINIFNYV